MKQTIKIILFLGLMLVSAGQAWGEGLGNIAYEQGTNDGGSLAFYKNAACTSENEITITEGESDNLTELGDEGKVYIKVTPDATHQARGVTIIIEKKVSIVQPDAPWWDGEGNARRRGGSGDKTITVETVGYGIYCFVMPDDGSNVKVSATFPTKTALTITADSDSKEYDGTALTKNSYTNTDLVEGDVIVSVTVTGSQTNVGSSNNVPSAAVIKNANDEDVTDCYSIAYENGTLTIVVCQSNEAIVALTIPEGGYTYDGTEKQPGVTVTIGTVTVEGTEYTVNYADNVNAGTVTVTVEDNQGGNVAFAPLSATFDIGAKTLTVTAKPKTITYGDAPANDGVDYDGFVDGEDESVLGGTLDYDYNYTQNDPVGTYYISPSGLTSTNYDITFANGTLTVKTKQIERESGTIVTQDENGYSVTVDEGNGSGGVIISSILDANGEVPVASLDYDRTLTAPDSGERDATIDEAPAMLYTTCLPTAPATGDNVKYYILSDVSGTTLNFNEIEDDPLADTPYLVAVMGSSDFNEDVNANNVTLQKMVTGETVDGFTMMGTQTGLTNEDAIAAGGSGNVTYILQDQDKWGKVVSGTVYIPPFRAFITGPDVTTSSGARKMDSSFGDDATGIDTLRLIDADGTEQWYDLQGRRIERPTQKGMYIHNGRKEVRK